MLELVGVCLLCLFEAIGDSEIGNFKGPIVELGKLEVAK